MGNSKIIYAGETLIDLTSDTVTAGKLEKGITAHGANGEPITGTLSRKLIFYNKTAATWASDTTYPDYPYRAAVVCSGVTTAYTPYVMFSEEDAALGILSRDANSYAGGIYIYASEIPESTISITEIICIEE